jgi:hypothetical protein
VISGLYYTQIELSAVNSSWRLISGFTASTSCLPLPGFLSRESADGTEHGRGIASGPITIFLTFSSLFISHFFVATGDKMKG